MDRRTFGVEEELLLVDAQDGRPVPAGKQVTEAAQEWLGLDRDYQVEHEFKLEQTEIGSLPSTDAADLRAQLLDLRRGVAAAAPTGVLVVALATSPLKVKPRTTINERYARMIEAFGLVARQQLTCGQHIHVGIESAAEGVAVIDRIRGWLPILTAISANSPFWQGQDTGYASYRSIAWGLWPTAGPTDPFGDPQGYRSAIDALVASGVALDEGMIYFDARLSSKYPTLEIRVPDVCTDLDTAVLLAVLARALVTTAATEWRDGRPAPTARVELVRGAAWRAARSGLTGDLVDPATGRPLPAWAAVDQFLSLVDDALRATGEVHLVEATLGRLREHGNGADVQRAVFARRESLADVVLDAAERTLA